MGFLWEYVLGISKRKLYKDSKRIVIDKAEKWERCILKDTPPNLGTESRGFEIEFTSPFLKRIKALDKEAQIRILREANILKTNPYAGKSLRGEWRGIFSLRVGDYRVLYKIREEQKRVVLLAVGHRKHVYKK